jgi:hypothetical protein
VEPSLQSLLSLLSLILLSASIILLILIINRQLPTTITALTTTINITITAHPS